MKKLSILFLLPVVVVAVISCGGDSATSPTSLDPKLTGNADKIIRSSANYYVISWQFTINSPKPYSYAYVEIKWFDKDDFQVDWSNWSGALKKGVHTYTDETYVDKADWRKIVRRKAELITWRD